MFGNIYLIYNDINEKVYIGKTYLSIEKRFSMHIHDYLKKRNINRPLYKAMKKYSPSKFHIIPLGSYPEGILEEKEADWIRFFDSFHNGYNATLGGDGKRYLEFSDEELIADYKKTNSVKQTAKNLNCCYDTALVILHNHNIRLKKNLKYRMIYCPELELCFSSVQSVAEYLKDNLGVNQSIKTLISGIGKVLAKTRKKYLNLRFSESIIS